MLKLLEVLKPFFSFLKSVYSEPDGTGSSTRLHITAILFFVLGVGSVFGAQVLKKNITIEQFNQFLNSGGEFVLTTGGPLYTANKAADWLKNRDNKE